jgi:hypothetical protein
MTLLKTIALSLALLAGLFCLGAAATMLSGRLVWGVGLLLAVAVGLTVVLL